MSKRHRILRCNRQRIAWTNTSAIPDAEIVAALRYLTTEADLGGVIVHFKRHGRARRWGMAYNGIPGMANIDGLRVWEWDYLIVVSDHGGDSMTLAVMDTLAHEAKHIEQFRHGGRGSEPPARAFGAGIAAKWAASR